LRHHGASCLNKMFSSYPDEWPGAGLLLLRAAIGTVLIDRAVSILLSAHDLKLAAIALVALGAGVLLVAGYLTWLATGLVAIASVWGILFWPSAPTIDFFESRLTTALVGVISAALLCLGPGALSLDSRLFGRKEIVFSKSTSRK